MNENMNTPIVSIIVPCYNVEKYLPKCVDSLLHQTYTNLEIWLVDDGSPDSCGKICDDYARKDNRINVIHKKNGGNSDAKNVAIDRATGEWIVFVDSDDYVSEDYIETLYGLVERNHCKVGVAWLQSFLEDTQPKVVQPSYEEHVFDNMTGIEKMFYQELFDTAAWCKIYHRSLFETGIRYPFGLIYEDLSTTYLLFLKADKVAFCNKIIYYYLLRKNSIEGQPFNKRKLDSALQIIDSIKSHSNELINVEKAVRCRMLSFCFHIMLEMPVDYADDRKRILQDYVNKNRHKVLFDHRARKKARVAALLSYFGTETLRMVLQKTNKRKKD